MQCSSALSLNGTNVSIYLAEDPRFSLNRDVSNHWILRVGRIYGESDGRISLTDL